MQIINLIFTSLQMSTGLMSCVRENSPPLEGVSIQQEDDGGFSHSPEPPGKLNYKKDFNSLASNF